MLYFTKNLTKVMASQNHISETRPWSGKGYQKISFLDKITVLDFGTRPGLRTLLKITLNVGTKWIFLQRSGNNRNPSLLKLCWCSNSLNLIGYWKQNKTGNTKYKQNKHGKPNKILKCWSYQSLSTSGQFFTSESFFWQSNKLL